MKLAIAIPLVQALPAEVVEGLLNGVIEATQVVRAAGGTIEAHTCTDLYPYDRARQFLLEDCIESGCDLLWAIDSDCLLSTGAFEKLWQTMRDRDAQAVLAHNYNRGYPYACCWFAPRDGRFYRVDAGSGVHQIVTGGLHCTLIDLQWVKDNMKKPYFKYVFSEDENERIAEDAYFFSEMGKAGGLVLGNANVRVGHIYTRICVSDKTVRVLRQLQVQLQENVT